MRIIWTRRVCQPVNAVAVPEQVLQGRREGEGFLEWLGVGISAFPAREVPNTPQSGLSRVLDFVQADG